MRKAKSVCTFLALLAAGVISGCGGGMSSSTTPPASQAQGNIFVIGTDAPLPASFRFK